MDEDAITPSQGVDKSVSDILSTYYSINEKHDLGNGKSDTTVSNDIFANTEIDFSSSNFDVELHLDDILKVSGISDTLALLRKLEREIRQLTAGKQILIYDNYECLFSALDTLHFINTELSTVQRHLSNLRSSEIKAASKDITSRHGIRDKLIAMSHFSGIINIFSSLASINKFFVTSLSQILGPGLEDGTHNPSPKEILSVCSKLYGIFCGIKGEKCSELLITFYYDTLKRLVSINTRKIIEDINANYTISSLCELCCIFDDLKLDKWQILHFYYKTLSSKIHRSVNNLNSRHEAGDISNNDLFSELYFILNDIYSAISSSDASGLEHRLKDCTKNGGLCLFCSSEFDIKFLESENDSIYSYYFLESNTNCECLTDGIKVQFILYHPQKVFFLLLPLILGNSLLNTDDIISGLTFLIEKIGHVETKNEIASLYVDVCHKWILFASFLYLQKLFFTLYSGIIDKIFEFITVPSTKYIDTLVHEDLQKLLVEDISHLFEFVKDLQLSLGIHIVTEFYSFLVVYILNIKKIFTIFLEELLSVKPEEKHTHSLTSLLTMREYAADCKPSFIREICFGQKSNNMEDSLDSQLYIDHYIRKEIAEKVEAIADGRKALLIRLILCIGSIEKLFEGIPNLLRAHFPGAIHTYNTLELTLECKMDISTSETIINYKRFVLYKTKSTDNNTPLTHLLPDDNIPFVHMIYIALKETEMFPLKYFTTDDDAREIKPFILENVNTSHLANKIISEVMSQYLNRAYSIIKYSLDKLENGHEVTGTSVKDFTVLLSEMLEDLNSITHTSSVELASVNVEFDNLLNFCNTNKDVLNLMGAYTFNLSKDMSLKLFTLHIAQCFNQYRSLYIVENDLFHKLMNGMKQQLLIVFKKTLDVIIMQSLWDKILDSNAHNST
ncbi:conserved hypothetical protein [Theileria equi strain WA]|uniref:Vacuolar protein sorting-associated protein 51 homolog n=1 Tax=Theileria equi strain WA TaxID=1537102 RepID=L1LBG5_THEEQ|nr:conserved hypothetical protein [Theileria equi strain WA]EKX72676.1 conserved hypothetical protein [Theileria equi strain WA]|eukprot:XP_004832128.1 conserved hypothetical protein [Theileria equi strain WA]